MIELEKFRTVEPRSLPINVILLRANMPSAFPDGFLRTQWNNIDRYGKAIWKDHRPIWNTNNASSLRLSANWKRVGPNVYAD